MTNSAYAKNNIVDLLYKLVFCARGLHIELMIIVHASTPTCAACLESTL